jgi:putative acetyltransferase
MLVIRVEKPEDIDAVRVINERAFEHPDEADLVDELRRNSPDLLSLVAVVDGEIVGHILFSPVKIEGDGRTIKGMGLAPMAVLPEHQRRGIGSALVREGVSRLDQRGCPFVIVLGHPQYYPRFGFVPASRYDIRCEWDVPDEAFMILILKGSALCGISGIAKYRGEFGEFT